MNFEALFAACLAALIVALAVYTVVARESFTAVVTFVVYGLLVSLAWMIILCPDVALTEAAVGGGVTGVLLLGACARIRREERAVEAQRPPPVARGGALLLCLGVTVALGAVVLNLPEPGPSLAPQAMRELPATGLGNPVTATLMAYRSLDTMLEKVVLLLALVAVWSTASDRFWGGRPDFGDPREAGGPLIFLARVLIPIGVMGGIFLFWVGADAPGGAFAGGAILSAMWILGFFAGLKVPPRVGHPGLRFALVLGIILFVIAGFAGFGWGSGFLSYPAAFAKPVIIVIEVGMTFSIGATLGLLVAGAPGKVPPS